MFWKNNLAAVTSCDNDWLPVLILCNDARPLVKAEQSLLVKDINELSKQLQRKSLDMYFIKSLHYFIRD